MVFTDNVLALLAGACAPIDNLVHSTVLNSMHDINNVAFTVNPYNGNNADAMQVSAVLSEAQVGKGTSTPTRQDFNIENPFTNGGEEDNRKQSLTAVYVNATEKIEMSTTIVPLGSGDITEVCKFVVINQNNGSDRTIMISRDLVNPPVGFINGEIINITNEVLT